MVATLEARQGHRLRVGASGPQATRRWRRSTSWPPRASATSGRLRPLAQARRRVRRIGGSASTGARSGAGPALDGRPRRTSPGDDETETTRSASTRQSGARHGSGTSNVGTAARTTAAIFAPHLALLNDPHARRAVRRDLRGSLRADAWTDRTTDWPTASKGWTTPTSGSARRTSERPRSRAARPHRERRPDDGDDQPVPGGPRRRPELDAATAATLDAAADRRDRGTARGTTGHGVIVAGRAGSR